MSIVRAACTDNHGPGNDFLTLVSTQALTAEGVRVLPRRLTFVTVAQRCGGVAKRKVGRLRCDKLAYASVSGWCPVSSSCTFSRVPRLYILEMALTRAPVLTFLHACWQCRTKIPGNEAPDRSRLLAMYIYGHYRPQHASTSPQSARAGKEGSARLPRTIPG